MLIEKFTIGRINFKDVRLALYNVLLIKKSVLQNLIKSNYINILIDDNLNIIVFFKIICKNIPIM